jgi:MFS family permease
MFAAVAGFQILMFGQFWLTHELTGSPLYLGYVGLANALPAVFLSFFGGVLADKLDKRRLIILTQALSSTMVFLLAMLTLLHVVKVWHVIVIAVFAGAVNAFNQPARMSLFPTLVPRKALTSAVALNSSVWQATRIVSPAIAGQLIVYFGTAASFFFAGASMTTFALVVFRLRVPVIKDRPTGSPVQGLMEGLHFVKDNSIFAFLIGMAFFTSFFGMTYWTQMPVFARDILKIGADGQGVLFSISGVGALITTLWLGSIGTYSRKGLVLIGGAAMTGLSVAGFALTSEYVGSYALACVFMFMVGIFTFTCTISIMSSIQMMVPDSLRGRIMGIYGITWNIMPLGGMYVGLVAGLIGTPFAVALGGLLVTLFAVGPALVNRQVRDLGSILTRAEESVPPEAYGRRLER